MEPTRSAVRRRTSNAGRGYVFISYKREEAETAEKIKDFLEGQGFSVWWDRSIQCGQVWNEVLDDAVKRAGCIVVLWSERAMESRWVMHEASSAIDREVYAPVRIQLCPIRAPYDRHQAIDLLDWKGEPAHPGILGLLGRVDALIPPRKTFLARAWGRAWALKGTIAALLFAASALSILAWQTMATRSQISQLAALGEQQTRVAGRLSQMASLAQRQMNVVASIATKFQTVTANYSVDLPLEHPALAAYVQRVLAQRDQPAARLDPLDSEAVAKTFIEGYTFPSKIVIQPSTASSSRLEISPLDDPAPLVSYSYSPLALTVTYTNMRMDFWGSLRSLSELSGKEVVVMYVAPTTGLPASSTPDERKAQAEQDALLASAQKGLRNPRLELKFDWRWLAFEGFQKFGDPDRNFSFRFVIPQDLSKIEDQD